MKKRLSNSRMVRSIVLLFVLILSIFLIGCEQKNYDNFAQCLTEKGVTFYGSSRCGHCSDMKHRFGDSMQYINYVECLGPDGGQSAQCAGIKYYPTFTFSDETELYGAVEFEVLSQKVGCPLE